MERIKKRLACHLRINSEIERRNRTKLIHQQRLSLSLPAALASAGEGAEDWLRWLEVDRGGGPPYYNGLRNGTDGKTPCKANINPFLSSIRCCTAILQQIEEWNG